MNPTPPLPPASKAEHLALELLRDVIAETFGNLPPARSPELTVMPVLLTTRDLARALRTSPDSIRRHVNQLPPAIRFGSQMRWRADDVRRWLDERAGNPFLDQSEGA